MRSLAARAWAWIAARDDAEIDQVSIAALLVFLGLSLDPHLLVLAKVFGWTGLATIIFSAARHGFVLRCLRR